MAPEQQNLVLWLEKVQAAKSRPEVFRLLEEFRPLTWSDEERSQMAKCYIRLIDKLSAGKQSSQNEAVPAASDGESPGGPVWYEKM